MLLSDAVFWECVWTLTSKAVQFCEALSCSSSQQPHVGSLHDTPRRLSLSLLPPLFPSSLSVSHHPHHPIHGEGSAPASCSTITSANPPPCVCISAVLIAPETQSNGHAMCAGVQLTGSPLFLVPLFPGIFFTSVLFLKPYVVSFAPPDPVLSLLLPPQLQNQSELRAPTAEKAAFFLDAAIAARSTSRPNADEEERRNSHMLFTLHIYQYRMEKSGKGGSQYHYITTPTAPVTVSQLVATSHLYNKLILSLFNFTALLYIF